MPIVLSKPALLVRVLEAVSRSGYQAIVVSRTHPFLLRVFRGEEPTYLNLRVYIWNCTHGGRGRAADEFRVQLTGVVPAMQAHETTVLLGWHEEYEVFAGFDIAKHAGQRSISPSIQVKQDALLAAHTKTFSAYERANGELAITFRPEFLVDYALNSAGLHSHKGNVAEYARMLSELDAISEKDIDSVTDPNRREVITTIKRKYRQADFRARVLAAYEHRCAMCGMQLELVEAAHILPVAADGSTDETANGVALCALHHNAFDRALVSFNERYLIEVSAKALPT